MKTSNKILFAALLAAGIVGCGKEEPKPAAKAEAPAEPSVSVKIAHAGPLTGSIAHLGKDDENGVRLAVDQTNAKKIKIDGGAEDRVHDRRRSGRSKSRHHRRAKVG